MWLLEVVAACVKAASVAGLVFHFQGKSSTSLWML